MALELSFFYLQLQCVRRIYVWTLMEKTGWCVKHASPGFTVFVLKSLLTRLKVKTIISYVLCVTESQSALTESPMFCLLHWSLFLYLTPNSYITVLYGIKVFVSVAEDKNLMFCDQTWIPEERTREQAECSRLELVHKGEVLMQNGRPNSHTYFCLLQVVWRVNFLLARSGGCNSWLFHCSYCLEAILVCSKCFLRCPLMDAIVQIYVE